MKRTNPIYFDDIQHIQNPIVKVIHNNITLNFLVDTGSNISYIDKNIIDLLNVTSITSNLNSVAFGSETVNEPVDMYQMDITLGNDNKTLTVASIDLTNVTNTFKSTNNINVRGIIGTQFLIDNGYTMDFYEGTMYKIDTSCYQTSLKFEL